jgi:hypothetical protein
MQTPTGGHFMPPLVVTDVVGNLLHNRGRIVLTLKVMFVFIQLETQPEKS